MRSESLVALLAGSAAGQADMTVLVAPVDGVADRFSITATFNSAIPGDATAIGSIWSDTSFELTGDGSDITIDAASASPGYTSVIFGGPIISNGPVATFVGVQPGSGLGNPDPSNPLSVVEFDYAGGFGSLDMRLFGPNSAFFLGDPSGGFNAGFYLYLDTSGNAGFLSFEVVIIPAPATLALGPVTLVAARRRRK